MNKKVSIRSLESEPVNNKSKDGYVNVALVTPGDKSFSIWESKKPIFDILTSKELFYFMRMEIVTIEKERFDVSFFDNFYRK
jgi:hypothetical protein